MKKLINTVLFQLFVVSWNYGDWLGPSQARASHQRSQNQSKAEKAQFLLAFSLENLEKSWKSSVLLSFVKQESSKKLKKHSFYLEAAAAAADPLARLFVWWLMGVGQWWLWFWIVCCSISFSRAEKSLLDRTCGSDPCKNLQNGAPNPPKSSPNGAKRRPWGPPNRKIA